MIRSHRSLSIRQRRALGILRAAKARLDGDETAADDVAPALAALADTGLLDKGICAPAAAFVSTPELRLLAELAQHQRRDRDDHAVTTGGEAQALGQVARLLIGLDIPLPVMRGVYQPDEGEGTPAREPTGNGTGRRRSANGTARARIVTALADSGTLYRHEVLGLGISRQYLSQLVKNGTLVRAGPGRYALPSG